MKRLVTEFPEHEKSSTGAATGWKIFIFYDLYDYTNSGGWGAFVAVAQKFPDTFEAKQVVKDLNQTEALLKEIKKSTR